MQHQLVCILSLLLPFAACWTQQYGDARSTSYIDYDGAAYEGWNYTTEPFVSQTSPSVNEQGVLFYPLRAYLVAISPEGKELWKTGVSPNGDAYLTNTVYSKEHDLVIVGGSAGVDKKDLFQVVAVNAESGNIVWTSVQNDLLHPTSISISVTADAVYCGGFDRNRFLALELKNGKVKWKHIGGLQVGIFMQTKVGPIVPSTTQRGTIYKQHPFEDEEIHKTKQLHDSSLMEETFLLPTDPFDGFGGKGRLYAYKVAWPGLVDWYSDVGFTAGGLFAFSNQGKIYGVAGGPGGSFGQAVFVLDSINGSILYNGEGYCSAGAGSTSGPAVDASGYVYYSCGNMAFSLTHVGDMRWVSSSFGNATANSVTGPSIHPNGTLYFIHNNQTKVYALSTEDGSLIKSYDVPELGYLEPPILVGDAFMYLMGFLGSAISIFPLKF